jgi:6,7-dimethyl-8-ribityllumazine synthase
LVEQGTLNPKVEGSNPSRPIAETPLHDDHGPSFVVDELTTENLAQAEARAGVRVGNAGADAADAAVVMVNLIREAS